MAREQGEREKRTRLGWREWVALPALGIPAVKAKVDTGARTSALHAFYVETFKRDTWVRFGIHPLQRRLEFEMHCEARIADRRLVSDSGGHREQRIIIETPVRVGEREQSIEIGLTDRETMMFRMLLGRTALRGWAMVDPRLSYRAGRSLARTYTSKRAARERAERALQRDSV